MHWLSFVLVINMHRMYNRNIFHCLCKRTSKILYIGIVCHPSFIVSDVTVACDLELFQEQMQAMPSVKAVENKYILDAKTLGMNYIHTYIKIYIAQNRINESEAQDVEKW